MHHNPRQTIRFSVALPFVLIVLAAIGVSPAEATSFTGATAIAAGNLHTVALKADGTIWTWGSNSDGQLGNASTEESNSVPVQVGGLSAITITAIAAGMVHTVALDNSGHVWTWGNNDGGQLGTGSTDAI